MIQPINRVRRKWLKDLRKEKGLTTREMAEVFGVSFQHYSDVETGRRNPSIELSIKISKYFDVPIERFLEKRTKFKAKGISEDNPDDN